jgi:hypothetical protein
MRDETTVTIIITLCIFVIVFTFMSIFAHNTHVSALCKLKSEKIDYIYDKIKEHAEGDAA